MFIAVAAERTRWLRFGTGVISLPYHHPFHVAQRMVPNGMIGWAQARGFSRDGGGRTGALRVEKYW